jgi:3-oxoacyl-[acyl-carrier protein] reductase
LSFDEFDKVIDINLSGTFNVTKALLELIEENGRIINISSIAGVYGQFGVSAYAASKAGVIGFTKSIAKEVARRGITVNAIAPGMVETQMTSEIDKKACEAIKSQIPLGRFAKPSEIADAVEFLASDRASYITRHVLHVDGGLTF